MTCINVSAFLDPLFTPHVFNTNEQFEVHLYPHMSIKVLSPKLPVDLSCNWYYWEGY